MNTTWNKRFAWDILIVGGFVLFVGLVWALRVHLHTRAQQRAIEDVENFLHEAVRGGKRSSDFFCQETDARISACNELLKEMPHNKKILYLMGCLYAQRAIWNDMHYKYDDACIDAQKEAECFKNVNQKYYVSAVNYLAAMQRGAGNWEEAVATCERLIQEVGPREARSIVHESLVSMLKFPPGNKKRDEAKIQYHQEWAEKLAPYDRVEKK